MPMCLAELPLLPPRLLLREHLRLPARAPAGAPHQLELRATAEIRPVTGRAAVPSENEHVRSRAVLGEIALDEGALTRALLHVRALREDGVTAVTVGEMWRGIVGEIVTIAGIADVVHNPEGAVAVLVSGFDCVARSATVDGARQPQMELLPPRSRVHLQWS